LIKESILPPQPSPAPVKTLKTIPPASNPQEIETDLAKLKAQYLPLFANMPQWLSTSQHLIFTDRKSPTDQSGKIEIIEYDGTNLVTVYTGQFEDDFVFPWPSGNKLVILTSLNSLATNLYAINLR